MKREKTKAKQDILFPRLGTILAIKIAPEIPVNAIIAPAAARPISSAKLFTDDETELPPKYNSLGSTIGTIADAAGDMNVNQYRI